MFVRCVCFVFCFFVIGGLDLFVCVSSRCVLIADDVLLFCVLWDFVLCVCCLCVFYLCW